MNKSEAINELAAALSKAQGKITGALKDSKNPFFKSNYADLASVMEALKTPFAENGLSYTQGISANEMVTMLMHSSGQWISFSSPILCIKANDPQSHLAAQTYARRGALSAIAGVAQVDDDGNTAANNGAQKEEQKEEPKKQPPAQAPKQNTPPPQPSNLVTPAQVTRFHALASKAKFSPEQTKELLKEYGYTSSNDIEKSKYNEICKNFGV